MAAIWINRKGHNVIEVICRDPDLLNLVEARLRGMYYG